MPFLWLIYQGEFTWSLINLTLFTTTWSTQSNFQIMHSLPLLAKKNLPCLFKSELSWWRTSSQASESQWHNVSKRLSTEERNFFKRETQIRITSMVSYPLQFGNLQIWDATPFLKRKVDSFAKIRILTSSACVSILFQDSKRCMYKM